MVKKFSRLRRGKIPYTNIYGKKNFAATPRTKNYFNFFMNLFIKILIFIYGKKKIRGCAAEKTLYKYIS